MYLPDRIEMFKKYTEEGDFVAYKFNLFQFHWFNYKTTKKKQFILFNRMRELGYEFMHTNDMERIISFKKVNSEVNKQ